MNSGHNIKDCEKGVDNFLQICLVMKNLLGRDIIVYAFIV